MLYKVLLLSYVANMISMLQGKAANVSASDACASQLVAQAHSSAAGQVASDAIEAAYGSGTSRNCATIA